MSQIIEHTLRLISRRQIRMMVFGMGLGGLVGCTCLSARPEEVVGNIAVLVVESFVAVWVLVKADSLMHSLISSQLGSLRSRFSAARDRLESTIGNTPSPRPDQARPSVLQRLDMAWFAFSVFIVPISLATFAFCVVARYFEFRVGDIHTTEIDGIILASRIACFMAGFGMGYIVCTIVPLRRGIASIESDIDSIVLPKVVTAEARCQRRIRVQDWVIALSRFILGPHSFAR